MPREYPPRYNDIPFSKRLEMVAGISETIPMDRIKFQRSGSKIHEIWGFVWLNGLPFCFRAWPSFPSQGELAFLRSGRGIDVPKTNWSPHAPYRPLNFHPPISAGEISKDDKVYLLRQLGIKEADIDKAVEAVVKGKNELDGLYRSSLGAKEHEYDQFYRLYNSDPYLSGAFGAAVSIKCDEVEKALKEEALQQQGV